MIGIASHNTSVESGCALIKQILSRCLANIFFKKKETWPTMEIYTWYK